MLYRGASGSGQVTPTSCLTGVLGSCSCLCLVACLLAGCLLNEGARESSSGQAITPARYDEGSPATSNHNAAIGESREGMPSQFCSGGFFS